MKKLILFSFVVLTILLAGCRSGKTNPVSNSNESLSVSSEDTSVIDTESMESSEFTVESSTRMNSTSTSTSKKASSNPISSSKTSSAASKATVSYSPRDAVNVLIPEGFTAVQIAERLEAKGVCKKTDFLNTMNTYDFRYYPLVENIVLNPNPNRCFRLEGYLFPDTYTFYINMRPQDAIGKMLKNAEAKINGKYKYTGMTTDEIITLASIIQKEAAKSDEMKRVSSVFHNRLEKYKNLNMKLQADPTIYYVEKFIKPNITGDINRFNAFYNTYKCKVPVGPICNPGIQAIQAAVSPVDSEYLYFVADANKNYYYATNLADHNANCKKAGVHDDTSEPTSSQLNVPNQ